MRESELYAERVEDRISIRTNERIARKLQRILAFDEMDILGFEELADTIARDIKAAMGRIAYETYLRELWLAQLMTIIDDAMIEEDLFDDMIDGNIRQLVRKNIGEWAKNVALIIKHGKETHLPKEEIQDLIKQATGTIGESGITYRLMRILRTEGNRTQANACLQAYKDAGIKQYIYKAILDDKVCEHCQSIDGQVFNVADAQTGINLPPLHPNCRCYIIPVGEKKHSIPFEEWRSKYIHRP